MKEEKGNEQQRSGGVRGKLAAVKAYAAAKNVQVSAKRYGVDAMGPWPRACLLRCSSAPS